MGINIVGERRKITSVHFLVGLCGLFFVVVVIYFIINPVDRTRYSTPETRKNIVQIKPSIIEESEFFFDNRTRPYKNIIIKGVNAIHQDINQCRNIDPGSAYTAGSKWTADKPVFYVTCGKGIKLFNIYFSKEDVENNKRFLNINYIKSQ